MTERKPRAKSATPRKDEATGTWWFSVELGPGPGEDGEWRQRRQTTRRGFRTLREAQAALDALRVDIGSRNTYIAPKRQTLRDYLEHWLTTLHVEPSTLESYSRLMRLHVIPRLGGFELTALEPATIRTHLQHLAAEGRRDGKPGGLSPRTVRYIATVLRSALQDAVEDRLLTHNPAVIGRRDRGERKTKKARRRADMHTWTAEQLRHFLALEEASTPGRRERAATKAPRYWPAFVFLATTGCRRGEALGLRWGDVDLEAGSCKFVQTITAIDHKIHIQSRGGAKSGDEREIELDPETIVVLKTWRAKQLEERLAMGVGYAAGDLVFCHPDGRPYHPDRFSREFDRRVKLHEMPRIRLHDLRHTWATLALEGGVDINVVKDRLGHSSIAVTADIYQHVTRKVQLGAAERVASLIFGPA